MNHQQKKTAVLLHRHIGALKVGVGATALAVSMFSVGAAQAQSTASQEMDEIIVVGQRGPKFVGGLITPETATKARSSIGQDYIETQSPGQSVAQLINLLPGVSFTNSDGYGNSGGNLRLRGFDGNRVSLTFDGMPLNDTGNYAIYTNQQLDAEIINRVNVNLGTTDVDSPTASAAGGTVNYITRRPYAEPGAEVGLSYGTDAYRRIFTVLDTGEFGPYQTSAFIAGSYTKYDKFRGIGELEKKQFNARVYQPLKGDDFISIAAHWNENRNHSYRYITKADIAANGWSYDYQSRTPTDLNNYFDRYQNPSNTGNIRAQSRFALTDNLALTFDPYIQYTLATGGSITNSFNENDSRLLGSQSGTIRAVDLNASCASAVVNANGVRVIPTSVATSVAGCGNDSVILQQSSITNTWRPGLTSSLIYDINDDHRIRVAYTLDYGRHRQTGEATRTDGGVPQEVFAGKENNPVYTADGTILQSRDRYSVAELNQIAAEYQGTFLEEALRVNVGLRAPFFKRELNQYCYTTLGTTVTCTSGAVPATTLTTAGTLPLGTTGVTGIPVGTLAPFQTTRKYDEVLPTFGATYRFLEDNSVYFNYSKGLSVPRTDSLYARTNPTRTATANTLVPYSDSQVPSPVPEKADNFDLGYRYEGETVVASVGAYYNKFTNFILSSVAPDDTNTRIDRNVGDVEGYGLNAEVGVEPIEDLTTYLTFSWDHREMKDDLPIGLDRRVVNGTVVTNLVSAGPSPLYYVQNGVVYVRTAGKQIVEVPEFSISGRVQYKWNNFRVGVDGKWTGKRYSTDVNDEETGDRVLFDMDIAYDFSDYFGKEGSQFQINVDNVFDKKYLGNINSGVTASAFLISGNPFTPQYQVGSPRLIKASLRLKF